MLQVKITKCSSKSYWYADKVGWRFNVSVPTSMGYGVIVGGGPVVSWIDVKDCEPLGGKFEKHRAKLYANKNNKV